MNADATGWKRAFVVMQAATLAAAVVGCAGSPTRELAGSSLSRPTDTAPTPPQDEFGRPPLASAAPEAPFPNITHAKLSNGHEQRVVPRKNYPLLEARLVVFSGSASDGAQTGVAALTGELLKVGGAGSWSGPRLIRRAESLGSNLEVETGRDSTQISMAVTTGDFDRALELIAAVVQAPRFSAPEFVKLKQRELERLKSLATASAEWAGSMALYRQLFRGQVAPHPYSHFEPTASELQKLALPSCMTWYRRNVTPKNATLVIVGDVEAADAQAGAQRWFAGWEGSRPPATTFEAPSRATERTVWIVDRPHSEQSQVYVAGLGPEANSPSWAAVDTANQILGGGVAGRLFLDVREKRSLAYRTGSSLVEVAHGPAPIVLSAGTQTAKTDLTVQALLENLRQVVTEPPTVFEVRDATRNLATSLLFRTETVGALANLAAKLAILNRPDGYYDAYRHALQDQSTESVFDAAKEAFSFDAPVIVVAGDAARIGQSLSRFGSVEILDPLRDFAVVRTLPYREPPSLGPSPPPPPVLAPHAAD
jgi:predicted Zn-dependent peptidase